MRTLPFIIVATLTVTDSFVGFYPTLAWFSVFFLLLVACLIVLIMCAKRPSSWGVPPKKRSARATRWTRGTIAGCVLLALSIPSTQWPLHLSFSLSRPSLERVAARVISGEKVAVPQDMGAFTLTYISRDDDGKVCLWINGNENDTDSRLYFVHGSSAAVKSEPEGDDVTTLDDQWSLVNSL